MHSSRAVASRSRSLTSDWSLRFTAPHVSTACAVVTVSRLVRTDRCRPRSIARGTPAFAAGSTGRGTSALGCETSACASRVWYRRLTSSPRADAAACDQPCLIFHAWSWEEAPATRPGRMGQGKSRSTRGLSFCWTGGWRWWYRLADYGHRGHHAAQLHERPLCRHTTFTDVTEYES